MHTPCLSNWETTLGIPHSRKLSQISRFCGYSQKISSTKFGGMVSFGVAKASNLQKFSPRKSYFSPIRESFLRENHIFHHNYLRKFSPSKVSRCMINCFMTTSVNYPIQELTHGSDWYTVTITTASYVDDLYAVIWNCKTDTAHSGLPQNGLNIF